MKNNINHSDGSKMNQRLQQYKEGRLSNEERYQLEMESLNDPFLAEAMEGIEESQDFSGSIRSLESRIGNKKKARLRYWYFAAASILLLCLVGYSLLDINNNTLNELALEKVEEEQNTPILKEQSAEPEELVHSNSNDNNPIAQKPERNGATSQPSTINNLPKTAKSDQYSSSDSITTSFSALLPNSSLALETIPTKKIKGIVLSDNNRPIAGAIVYHSAITQGVVTNEQGEFELVVPIETDIINLMQKGYFEQSVVILDSTQNAFTLDKDWAGRDKLENTDNYKASYLNTERFETSAEPVVGFKKFYKYLKKEIKKVKPKQAQGQFTINLSIDENGTIEGYKIISNSVSPILLEEIFKLILSGPPWKPAIKNGKNVESVYILHVTI